MQSTIRLALVITELYPGGAERCLVELATRLDRAQFAPFVYSLGPQPPPDRQLLVARLQQADVPIRFLDLRSYWQYRSGVRRLADLFRSDQIDLCQAFLFHANLLASRAAQLAATRRFVAGIRVADPSNWRSFVERAAVARADAIVCVSQGVADFCRNRKYPTKKLVVIRNGVDLTLWQNALPADLCAFAVPPRRRIFTYVGRLDRQKGLDRFFHELPRLFSELPDHDFLLVGDGPQERELRSLAARLKMQSRVHFAGWRSDIPAILSASDLVVLPSRWEGLPNVLLEGMAAGKPIAALRAEGVAEVLGDSVGQQSAAGNDLPGLCALIVKILHNAKLANDLGNANHQRVQGEFSINAMVMHYQSLYAELAR